MSAPSEVPSASAVETPVATTQTPAIEAETDDVSSDADSAIGGSAASSTTSIGDSILNYRKENGRRYHAYKDGQYAFPNDEEENDRLDLQHHLMYLTFSGKLYTAPIPNTQQLHRVLDVGTGTGIWAIDFASPPNLTFQIDDIEEDWTFHEKFDFIYSRMMTGSLANWPRYFSQALENLNPGGWMEVVDICLPYRSDDGTLKPDSAIMTWTEKGIEAARLLGREIHTAHTYKARMITAGFENVTEVVYKWPINQWPKDKKMKEIGMWSHENIVGSLEGLSIALFTRGLGWSREALEVFLVDVRKEMNDKNIHAWVPIYVVYGQKPTTS